MNAVLILSLNFTESCCYIFLQADESVIVSRETIAQLFAHEATRVFHDRLTDDNDRKLFYQFLSDDLHNYFKVEQQLIAYMTGIVAPININ